MYMTLFLQEHFDESGFGARDSGTRITVGKGGSLWEYIRAWGGTETVLMVEERDVVGPLG